MQTLIVTTQAEFDALPSSFPEITEIEIRAGTVLHECDKNGKKIG